MLAVIKELTNISGKVPIKEIKADVQFILT